jgi:peptidyl-prolyl cis-trans isomerase C
MRSGVGALAVFGVTFAITCGLGTVRADEPSRAVVATVGSAEITAAELEKRLRLVPDFQLATLGKTLAEQKRNFLDQVMVREVLLAEGAKAKKLDESPAVLERTEETLRAARLALLKAETAITPEEVATFFVENHGKFDSPERVGVFRILCRTKEEAASVLADAKQAGTLARWNELAREHSVDRATALRGGNLGFLGPDGSSSEPSVRVEPALFSAAARVKDGEFVPEPIKEGEGFAAVWRRGTLPAVHRSVEEEASAIRQVLVRKKLEERMKALLKDLRENAKVTTTPNLIDVVEIDSNGAVVQRKRPGVVPSKPSMPPAPSATPRGLR